MQLAQDPADVVPSVGLKPDASRFRAAASSSSPADYVLVGGGLQNALLALALLDRKPDVSLIVLEREARFGGNHTWCFHASDVAGAAPSWLDDLVVRRWPAHEVIFPDHRRRVGSEYLAITSERLDAVLRARLARAPRARFVQGRARSVRSTHVELVDGQTLHARLIVDARGPAEPGRIQAGGFQKFLGLELGLARGKPPPHPILMDATVPQVDGFRFMYALPWSEDRVLLEDTYYSTSPHLDRAALEARVLEYASARGLRVREVLRREHGVLPLPTRAFFRPKLASPLVAGYAGGLFHPTTGYSFCVALRFALHVAARGPDVVCDAEYTRWLAEHQRQLRFCVLLNRLLFGAFAPEARWHVLSRFYRLPEGTIRRFYALDTRASDRARIVCGRPPAGFSLARLVAGGQA